jgi:chitin synthase
LFIVQF